MYYLYLKAVGNPDRGQAPGQLWGLPPQKIEVATLEEAASALRLFIDENHLGMGNIWGAHLYRIGQRPIASKAIAFISYNGRAWRDAKCSLAITTI